LANLTVTIKRYLSLNSLVFDFLDDSLYGNVLGLSLVGNVGHILGLDFDGVVVSDGLLLGNLDLDGLSLVLENLLLVRHVFDSGLTTDGGGLRSNSNGLLVGNRGGVGHWGGVAHRGSIGDGGSIGGGSIGDGSLVSDWGSNSLNFTK
jgi:hypothetical protein